MSNPIMAQTAKAVTEAIEASGKPKTVVSEGTGIPYPTLNRKCAGKTEFSFSELYLIAEELGISPSEFTPRVFQRQVPASGQAAA